MWGQSDALTEMHRHGGNGLPRLKVSRMEQKVAGIEFECDCWCCATCWSVSQIAADPLSLGFTEEGPKQWEYAGSCCCGEENASLVSEWSEYLIRPSQSH